MRDGDTVVTQPGPSLRWPACSCLIDICFSFTARTPITSGNAETKSLEPEPNDDVHQAGRPHKYPYGLQKLLQAGLRRAKAPQIVRQHGRQFRDSHSFRIQTECVSCGRPRDLQTSPPSWARPYLMRTRQQTKQKLSEICLNHVKLCATINSRDARKWLTPPQMCLEQATKTGERVAKP